MPYYGPRVGVGPIEDLPQRIAGAFKYIEEKPLREAERRAAEAEARAAEREADVYGARAYEMGLTPEGAEELPERPSRTARDVASETSEIGRTASQLAGRLASRFGVQGVGAIGEALPSEEQIREADLSPQDVDERPSGLSEVARQMGRFTGLPSVGRGLERGAQGAERRGERRIERAFSDVDTENRGLPPGDIRAPLGTPGRGETMERRAPGMGRRPGRRTDDLTAGPGRRGEMREVSRDPLDTVIQEREPAGVRLESGTVYRPTEGRRDEFVQRLMQAYPDMTRAEAEIAADRRLGQTALSDYLKRQRGRTETGIDYTGGERTDRATTLAVRIAREHDLDPATAADFVFRNYGLSADPENVRDMLQGPEKDEPAVSSLQRQADYIYTQRREAGDSMQEAAQTAYEQAGVYPDVGEYQQYRYRESRPQRNLEDIFGRPRQGTIESFAWQELQRGTQPEEILEVWVQDVAQQTDEEAPSITSPEFDQWLNNLPEHLREEWENLAGYLSPEAGEIRERRYGLPPRRRSPGGGG